MELNWSFSMNDPMNKLLSAKRLRDIGYHLIFIANDRSNTYFIPYGSPCPYCNVTYSVLD